MNHIHKTWSAQIEGSQVVIHSDGEESICIPALYLRDHCPCEKCHHAVTRQRQIDLYLLDQAITAKDVKFTPDELKVHFSDNHFGSFSITWILSMLKLPAKNVYQLDMTQVSVPSDLFHWSKSSIESIHPCVSYHDMVHGSEDGLDACLENIAKYGFSFVKDCPATIEASQQVAERISFIKETHYGRMWSFSTQMDHNDTAYTTLPLQAHTDTTYFTEPIGLQMLHVVQHDNGTGGESILIDGFHVAKQLLSINPKAYHILSTFPVPTRNDDRPNAFHQCHPHPLLKHRFDNGQLCQVRFNNDDRIDLPLTPQIMQYYEAVQAWNSLVRSDDNVFVFKLNPGELLIFDNWRLLHGRKSFTGFRKVVGCYIGHDDFTSALYLSRQRQKDASAVI